MTNEYDLPTCEAERQTLLAAWQGRRIDALRAARPVPALAWLNEAFSGLALALAGKDAELSSRLAHDALTISLAMATGGESGCVARVQLADKIELSLPCVPLPAFRWRDAVLLSCVLQQPAALALLGSSQPAVPQSGGDVFALRSGRVWLAWLCGADLTSPLAELRDAAEGEEEFAWLIAFKALVAGETLSAAHLAALPALQKCALQSLARLQGSPCASEAAPALLNFAQQISLQAPGLLSQHPREPNWWLDLYGLGGERSHRLVGQGSELQAQFEDVLPAAGLRLSACFRMLPDADKQRPCLDAGELLQLAERRAQQVNAAPPAEHEARSAQRALLDDALSLLAAARTRLPAAVAVTENDFPSARGLAVFRAEPGRFDSGRLEAVQRSWRDLLAQYDAHGATERPPEPELDARQAALAAINILRSQLEPLLWAIARDDSGELAQRLRPRDEDYAKVFRADVAGALKHAYAAAWEKMPPPKPAYAAQTELLCHLAPAGMLVDDNELSHHFPGGYRAIAQYLNPQRVWVRWKFVRPGESAGMAYDGLVWVDDHWAWLPKPYRVVGELTGQR